MLAISKQWENLCIKDWLLAVWMLATDYLFLKKLKWLEKNSFTIVIIFVYHGFGRGDSSHLVTRGDSSHSPFWGENTWKSKNRYYHQKGRVIISKRPRFQPHTTNVTNFLHFSKKYTFLPLVKFGWSQSPVYVQFIVALWKIIILIWNLLCTLL